MSKPVIHFLPSHEVHLTTSCGKVDPPEWSRIERDVTCKRCLAMMTKLSPSPILAAVAGRNVARGTMKTYFEVTVKLTNGEKITIVDRKSRLPSEAMHRAQALPNVVMALDFVEVVK